MKKVILILSSVFLVSNAFAYKILNSGLKDIRYYVVAQCKDGSIQRVDGINSQSGIEAAAAAACKNHGGIVSRQIKVITGKNSASDGPKNNNTMPGPGQVRKN